MFESNTVEFRLDWANYIGFQLVTQSTISFEICRLNSDRDTLHQSEFYT